MDCAGHAREERLLQASVVCPCCQALRMEALELLVREQYEELERLRAVTRLRLVPPPAEPLPEDELARDDG
jgi:hypothetical protein